jgi:hypothetical protein
VRRPLHAVDNLGRQPLLLLLLLLRFLFGRKRRRRHQHLKGKPK